MKQLNLILTSTLLLCATVLPSSAQVSNDNADGVNRVDRRQQDNDFVPGQVLVKFKDESSVQVRRNSRGQIRTASISEVDKLLSEFGVNDMEKLFPNEVARPKSLLRSRVAPNGTVVQEKNLDKVFWVKTGMNNPDSTLQLIEKLKAIPEVEYAEPNYYLYITENTPALTRNAAPQITMTTNTEAETTANYICLNPSQNPLYSQQYGIAQQNIHQLWDKRIINRKRPVIAIIDTGVDITHPDLVDNIWTNPKEIEGEKGYDDDRNGYNDDINGWNFVDGNNIVTDLNRHGTHVAGIAAGADNELGIVGANPLARIMPVRVMDANGRGDAATIARGIVYAAENGADILNLSLGGPILPQAEKEALDLAYQSAIIVAAAGNSGLSIYKQYTGIAYLLVGSGRNYPGAYHLVLGVEATQEGGQRASYSNYDPDGPVYSTEGVQGCNYEVQVAGSNIYSTLPDGNYGLLSGTSMASPLFAGAISALMMIKDYPSRDALIGDLIHLKADFAKIYSDNTSRKPMVDCVSMDIDDSAGNGNGKIDVGETVSLLPTLRNTWTKASGIRLKLTVEEKYRNVVTILNPEIDFGYDIPVYECLAAAQPFKVRFSENIDCGDENTSVQFSLEIRNNENPDVAMRDIDLNVYNMVEISGLISENTALTSDRVYHVTDNIGIMEGVTLTIEPGTRLEFDQGTGLSSFGKLIAKGTPSRKIVFTGYNGAVWSGIKTHESTGQHSHDAVLYTNEAQTLFTLLPTKATPNKYTQKSKVIYYGANDDSPYKLFSLKNYIKDFTSDMTSKQDLLTDPNYLTSAVLQMLSDWEAYWSQYPTQYSADKPNSTWVYANFFSWSTYDNPRDTISYCRIEDIKNVKAELIPTCNDCIFSGIQSHPYKFFSNIDGVRNNILSCIITDGTTWLTDSEECAYFGIKLIHSNIVNNRWPNTWRRSRSLPNYCNIQSNNYFNNYAKYNEAGSYYQKEYSFSNYTLTPSIAHNDNPSYFGTGKESIIRPFVFEIGNALETFGKVDLSNMLTAPIAEAHGIVWKVCVNGKDAQDEYEDLAPLGVGKHKFEVYFNRPMNKAVAPEISFGVQEPYTQIEVNEDGSWNNEGTIYTAYKTITGKTSSDGINRIYVRGAEDNEYFECPYENTRFNIIVNAAGSMATGFTADAGMGRVNLTWNNSQNDFEDAMGFNVYRFTEGNEENPTRINQAIIGVEETSYIDYDVTPGTTYYYYYKVLSTDLKEFDISNVVACIPLTAIGGDANGDGYVNVLDVTSTVDYIVGNDPKPFIFEAADMNTDLTVDVLDVVGIVNKILSPNGIRAASSENVQEAIYTIENGMLYIETPVALAGLQLLLNVADDQVPTPASSLKGFEQATTWFSENDYQLLAYNIGGRQLEPGKHAILDMGDAEISSIRLSDRQGRLVRAVPGQDTTGIKDAMGSKVKNVKGIYNLNGQKMTNSSKLLHGVYIINGQKVVK